MFCKYEELKAYVGGDFERFYKWGFPKKQIFSAVLDEYEHGEDFCFAENICIHVAVALKYAEKGWSTKEIVEKMEGLMNESAIEEVKTELGNEYTKLMLDLKVIGYAA